VEGRHGPPPWAPVMARRRRNFVSWATLGSWWPLWGAQLTEVAGLPERVTGGDGGDGGDGGGGEMGLSGWLPVPGTGSARRVVSGQLMRGVPTGRDG
jgi:hypothetical protein